MGIVAAPARITRAETRSQAPTACAAALYAIVVGATLAHHEPWADEAQSWLLARDSSLYDLWTRLLHYEGTPGLWQTLIHALIRLGMPYAGLNVVSALLGCGAVWILLRYSPLPLVIRLSLPFTYFLSYQYSVIARGYSLLPLLLFGIAALYSKAFERPFLLALLLGSMAAVSLQGLLLSASISVTLVLAAQRRWDVLTALTKKRLAFAAAAYCGFTILMCLAAWPAKDVVFPAFVQFRPTQLLAVAGAMLREAFTGQWFISLAVVVLSIPFLWRGDGFLVFLLSTVSLCVAGFFIYAAFWHYGLLFLSWIFAIWVTAQDRRLSVPVIAALALVISVQCYWAFRSIQYDWGHAYSGSREAAQFLKTSAIPRDQIFAAGFPTTAIQPYFQRNRFANINGGADRAYWDWSSHNRSDDPKPLFSSAPPDYFLAGYKAASEQARWSVLAGLAGYQFFRHFDGNLFWHTAILEPESYDLYKRTHGANPTAAATIAVGDPSAAKQLLSGFYAVEANAWRWTGRNFSVVLKTPADAGRKGARLSLRIFIPDTLIQKLGAITIYAEAAGTRLAPETFSRPGQYVYSRDLSSESLQVPIVTASFSLDKAMPPSSSDGRELGVIVSFAGLETK